MCVWNLDSLLTLNLNSHVIWSEKKKLIRKRDELQDQLNWGAILSYVSFGNALKIAMQSVLSLRSCDYYYVISTRFQKANADPIKMWFTISDTFFDFFFSTAKCSLFFNLGTCYCFKFYLDAMIHLLEGIYFTLLKTYLVRHRIKKIVSKIMNWGFSNCLDILTAHACLVESENNSDFDSDVTFEPTENLDINSRV